MQVRSVSGHEEVCRYATTYILKCRYGAYPVMKKYAGMQLRIYLNVGMERIRVMKKNAGYATAYVLKYRYGAYLVMKKYAGIQLHMYLNVGTKRIRS
jgi:hypothetical protein